VFSIFIMQGIVTDMVREVQPKGKWKVLVVDNLSLKIVSMACKMYDILEENVTCNGITCQPWIQTRAIR
jgi:hypothetical protein